MQMDPMSQAQAAAQLAAMAAAIQAGLQPHKEEELKWIPITILMYLLDLLLRRP